MRPPDGAEPFRLPRPHKHKGSEGGQNPFVPDRSVQRGLIDSTYRKPVKNCNRNVSSIVTPSTEIDGGQELEGKPASAVRVEKSVPGVITTAPGGGRPRQTLSKPMLVAGADRIDLRLG